MATRDLVDIAKEYLRAVEEGATGERLAAFYTADAEQEEFPNRLLPNGARRTLADILVGAERGQKLMASQRFEVLGAIAQENRVVVELHWTGNLRVNVPGLPEGSMHARFAVFMEFEGDKIRRQRNYDCFDPW